MFFVPLEYSEESFLNLKVFNKKTLFEGDFYKPIM